MGAVFPFAFSIPSSEEVIIKLYMSTGRLRSSNTVNAPAINWDYETRLQVSSQIAASSRTENDAKPKIKT